MQRALTALFALGLAVAATAAHAETELAVFPVGTSAEDVRAVKSAIGKGGLSLGAKSIDATCAADPGCLSKLGSEVGVRRVLAVTVTGPGTLSLMLVDAGATLLLGTRDIAIAPKKLARQLGPTLDKFVTDAIVEKAKALFAEGNQHYNLGEFSPALDRYKLAYRIKPLPAFQFNIAQCHRKLGQHREAIAMYQAYLVGVPDARNKAMVDSLIAESSKALSEQEASSAQRERERLATERAKAEAARKVQEAEAVARAEAARAEQARIVAEREREQQYDRHPTRKWMLLTGGLGIAAAGVGAYFGVQARTAQDAFDEAGCGDPDTLLGPAALAQCVDDRDRGERSALLGNILIGTGGTVVITSLLVLVLDPGNIERPATPRVAVSGNGVQVMFRW